MAVEGWRSYTVAVDAYERGRASYPDEAVDTALRCLSLRAGDRVADVGAGTGIFSALLAERGLVVDAVEPVADMRARIPRTDHLRAHGGTAEETGLPGACYDAVFAATAWHWFDAARAATEARRLLRPGGGLGLIWTGYDEEVPWVAELAAIPARRRPATSPRGQSRFWRPAFEALPGWDPLRVTVVRSTWRATPSDLVTRLRSSSVIAALPTSEQQRAVQELEQILLRQGFASRDAIEVPYSTEVLWTQPDLSA